MRQSKHRNRPSLVDRCRSGEREAFHALYTNYYHQLFKTAQHYVDGETARDMVHDAMIIAITSIDTLRDPEHLGAWMNQIVRNIALNHIKHNSVIQLLPLETAKDIPVDNPNEAPIPFDALMSMVECLPNGYKQVFRLKTLAGLSHDEIAHRLGISSSTSRSQFTHARRMLRAMVHHWLRPVALMMMVALYVVIGLDNKHEDDIAKPKIAKDSVVEPEAKNKSISSGKAASSLLPEASLPSATALDPHLADHQVTSSDSLRETLTIDTITAVDEKTDEKQSPPQSSESPQLPNLNGRALALDTTKWSVPIASSPEMSVTLAFSGLPRRPDILRSASIKAISSLGISGIDETNIIDFDNWTDYYWFIKEETEINPTEENRSLEQIAASNVLGNPQQQIEQRVHHDLPFTVSLSLNKTLSNAWCVGTGLSYSRLHSVFDMGYSQAFVRNAQTIHYLGIPANASYMLMSRPRFSLYGTVGATLDIPVSSSLTTQHLLKGQIVFSQPQHLSVPVQWSVNAALGIQYNITPHVGIFAQPGVTYYINNGTQTSRTEHPWSLTIPVGLKFTW